MGRTLKLVVSLAVMTVALMPAHAWADNTTFANSYSIAVGGWPVEATVNSTTPVERWYNTRVFQGRSYCAETQGGVFFDSSGTAGLIDTTATIYQSDATTVVVTNDDTTNSTEPSGRFLSRACFRSTLADGSLVYIRITGSGAFNVRMRFVETTQYSNWFFIGGDYNAFTIIRNTTGNALNYTVEWRDANGAIVATTGGALAGNAGAILNARAFTATTSGTVQVAHDASESAIVASTTVLSTTTGLSFDSPFEVRRPW